MKTTVNKKAILEVSLYHEEKKVVFNMVFLDTGEILQKTRSFKWLMNRVYFHELRTRKKRGEIIEYDDDCDCGFDEETD